ncbi:conserved hypothetical protein [Desulfamplus magnetovallimortis]|uniref:Methyltransferase small domain-containing protein n=1 Tax=Desulfamplus magnetovallimortis TaxID=1246637 RepID=A0A1W1HCY0_9BACT|nr:class I SAM-dependent methyltransferase [Desulfamplus magnetovallimortis]SLM30351.1 conserved hypothetical protein [Desulfamplus magnetovallimortis]
MNLHTHVNQQVKEMLGADYRDEPSRLNDLLRLLGKWRSVLIQNTLLQHNGTVVMEGPLHGMDYLAQSSEGCHIAKLLGCYEQPLHPFIEEAFQTPYQKIINIGCAEGYYAVGFALKMPDIRVMAFDVDEGAREKCKALAAKNGVIDRIEVGGLFRQEDFKDYINRKVLILCDIEGGERDLLDPAGSPALKGMDIILESHECLIPGITMEMIRRFKDSHRIVLVQDNGQRQLGHAPDWFNNLAHLDQLLATWEWRSGPTPWLVMKALEKS